MADNTEPVVSDASLAHAALDPIAVANTIVTEVVSPSGATTTSFETAAPPAPPEPPPEPAPEAAPVKTTVIVTHSEVNDAFVNWLEATGAVLSSIVTSISEVLGKPDEVRAREDYIRIIMSVKGVDEAEAENLYQKFLQEKRQKTPGDIVQNTLRRDL